MSKSRRTNKVQFLMKDQMSTLFRKTERHHSKRLMEMFRKFYWPMWADDEWTIGISHDVTQEFKLHFSWQLGKNVFHLNRTQIGLEILNTCSKMGVLLFLKKTIKRSWYWKSSKSWFFDFLMNFGDFKWFLNIFWIYPKKIYFFEFSPWFW